MNTYIPFICLAAGAAINWKGLPESVLKLIDKIMNIALMFLMAIIGVNIGTSDAVMSNLSIIGLNCALISVGAVLFSVAVTVLFEKSIMPLEKIRLQVLAERESRGLPVPEVKEEKGGLSPLVLIMPGFIALGIICGYFMFKGSDLSWLDTALTISLILLYTSVGVSLADNKAVFGYIKRLGLRVLLMPLAVFIGSVAGGLAVGVLLGVPAEWSMISGSGMGYYSLTGAFMTENYGIEAGTYGFMVNVLRDVFTVALLPVLRKISKGSPIASGAGGCMDTMLVPVTSVVGPELGMVAIISGTVITFVVPVWLPVAAGIAGHIFA